MARSDVSELPTRQQSQSGQRFAAELESGDHAPVVGEGSISSRDILSARTATGMSLLTVIGCDSSCLSARARSLHYNNISGRQRAMPAHGHSIREGTTEPTNVGAVSRSKALAINGNVLPAVGTAIELPCLWITSRVRAEKS